MATAAILSWLSKVAKGTSPSEILVPCFISCPKSDLEMSFEQHFLNQEGLKILSKIGKSCDGLERISMILQFLMDPSRPWSLQKPMHPVVGEFLCAFTIIDGDRYEMFVEQISTTHLRWRLIGPNFTLSPNQPVGDGTLSVGLGCLDISFPNDHLTILEYQTPTGPHRLTFNTPAFRIENLLSLSGRTAGLHSKLTIHDSQSDTTFIGKISKPLKLTGHFVDCNSNEIGSISGSIISDCIKWKDGREFIKAIKHQDTIVSVDDKYLNHPKYYRNVWDKVFELMNDKKYQEADKERLKVIDRHSNGPDGEFISQFGF